MPPAREKMNAMMPATTEIPRRLIEQPGQETDDAAGRQRAADATEHAPENRAADQRENEQERQQREEARHVLRGRTQFRRGQWLAFDHAHDAIDARIDAAVIIAALELRHDVLLDDAIRRGIRQRALDAVTHLDAHATIVQRDDDDRAVVDPLAAEAPLARPRESSTARFPPAASSARSVRRSGCPCACSNARSLASSAETWSGVSVPVRSVTGAFSSGTATSSCACTAPPATSTPAMTRTQQHGQAGLRGTVRTSVGSVHGCR